MRKRLALAGFALAIAAGAVVASVAFDPAADAPIRRPLPNRAPTTRAEAPAHAGSAAKEATAAPRSHEESAGGTNILPGDYVGPEPCKSCHAQRYEQWRKHPHSRMNQLPTAEAVMGDFSGARIQLPQGDVRFDREGELYTMTLEQNGKPVRKYRVTRTVGSRFMQLYVGTQLEGPEPADHPIHRVEHKLPFGYWFRLERWLPVHYFDPLGPEHRADGTPVYEPFGRPDVHPYTSSCMLCHNTYAYLYRLGINFPQRGFSEEQLRADPAFLLAAFAKAVDLSGSAPGEQNPIVSRLRPEHLVTIGISCESCHFGAREHAEHEAAIGYAPKAPLLHDGPAPVKGVRTDADTIVALCTQCHSAPQDKFPNGAGVANSREALDLSAGGCKHAIKCTDCHDPHKATGAAHQPARPGYVAACVRCHDAYASREAALAHGGHPASAEVSCLDCHMPRITQGIDEVVRSHTISSPSDVRMLAAGSANACNVCHLNESIRWTLEHLEKRWRRKIEPDPRWAAAYGGRLDNPVGKVWLFGPDPYLRLVAGQSYGRSRLAKSERRDLIRALEDEHAVNRVFAIFAVERALGRRLGVKDYDPAASKETRARQIEALLAAAE